MFRPYKVIIRPSKKTDPRAELPFTALCDPKCLQVFVTECKVLKFVNMNCVTVLTQTLDLFRHDSILKSLYIKEGTAVAQWLRCCAINRKVAVSIPASVIGYFVNIKSFRSHYSPGVDSASNRNEYREHFLGVKAAGA